MTDINDNPPAFMSDSYAVKMRDPIGVADFIIGTSALDPDRGINGTVRYSLSGANADRLSIDASTGLCLTLPC